MKLEFTAFLMFLGVVCGELEPYAASFTNCAPNLNLPVQIAGVLVTSSFPDQGKQFNVETKVVAQSNVKIVNGTVLTMAYMHDKLLLLQEQSNLCAESDACFSTSGSIILTNNIKFNDLPSIWGTDMVERIELYGADGNPIGCVQTNFAVMRSGSEEAFSGVILFFVIATLAIRLLMTAWSVAVPELFRRAEVVNPSFIDLVLLFQFITMMGQISGELPDFYRRITARFSISTFQLSTPFMLDLTRAVRKSLGIPAYPNASSILDGNGTPLSSIPNGILPADNGLVRFAKVSGIAPYDLFLYTFFYFLFITIIYTCLHAIFCVALEAFKRRNGPSTRTNTLSLHGRQYCAGLMALAYLSYVPFISTAIFQFSLKGDVAFDYAWAGIILALLVLPTAAWAWYSMAWKSTTATEGNLLLTPFKNMFNGTFDNEFYRSAIFYRLAQGAVLAIYSGPWAIGLMLVLEIYLGFMIYQRKPSLHSFTGQFPIGTITYKIVVLFFHIAMSSISVAGRVVREGVAYFIIALHLLAFLVYIVLNVRFIISRFKLYATISDQEQSSDPRETGTGDLESSTAQSHRRNSTGKQKKEIDDDLILVLDDDQSGPLNSIPIDLSSDMNPKPEEPLNKTDNPSNRRYSVSSIINENMALPEEFKEMAAMSEYGKFSDRPSFTPAVSPKSNSKQLLADGNSVKSFESKNDEYFLPQ